MGETNGREEQTSRTPETPQTPQTPETPPKKQPRDAWDKADILSKFAIPIVIGLLGFWGNHYLNKKQEADNNMMLYTQLLSSKEASENVLRKDMFSQILQSFIGAKSEKTGIDKIKEMRLSLDLLSRNFHESLDMKPLFRHLLGEILRQSSELRHARRELKEALEAPPSEAGDVRLKAAVAQARAALEHQPEGVPLGKGGGGQVVKLSGTTHAAPPGKGPRSKGPEGKGPPVKGSRVKASTLPVRQQAEQMRDKVNAAVAVYDAEMRELVDTAKRVSRKQSEVLQEVAGTLKLAILHGDQEHRLICTDYKPPLTPPPYEGEYKDAGCVVKEERVVLRNAAGYELGGSARHFKMRVRYAYPQWRRVYVETESWACVDDGIGRTCERCRKEQKKRETSAFWLDYFSFPLVDNSYIDNDHRYSVMLEEYEVDQEHEIRKIGITLLYYPAAYAGLKEKSYYDNQLFSNLAKWKLFQSAESAAGR